MTLTGPSPSSLCPEPYRLHPPWWIEDSTVQLLIGKVCRSNDSQALFHCQPYQAITANGSWCWFAYKHILNSRRYGGQLILRIEDTDRSRHVAEAEKAMEEVLTWAGLPFNESMQPAARAIKTFNNMCVLCSAMPSV